MSRIEIGSIQRPAAGQLVCGDVFSVLTSGPRTTLAVADGLGHGPKAADAAKAFCAYAESHKEEGLEVILRGAHRHLTHSRGAAGALVRIDEQRREIEFSGVGNIELRAQSRQRITPVSVPGALGINLRKTLLFRYEISEGDILTVFSDGMSTRMEIHRYRHLAPQKMAEALLDAYGKHHDDVTCLVIVFHDN